MGACLSQEPDKPAVASSAAAASASAAAKRLALLRALGVLDSTDGPDQFDAITKLLCSVFNVPIALVSLVDAERQWFKSVQGLPGCQETGREESFCAWTLLPESPYVLVVEDALLDRRFRENPLVTGPPGIRFYAGAPLISSANGYRYGTLCVIDTKPHHEFATEQYNMLIQFAELCVREIEKDKLTTLQRMVQSGHSDGSITPMGSLRNSANPDGTPPPSVAAAEQSARWGLDRAVDCFREGVLLVDVSTPTWMVLYTNDAFTGATGVSREDATRQGFWELYSSPGLGPTSFLDAIGANEPFAVIVTLQPALCPAPLPIAIDFRPAATGRLSGPSELVGIPADINAGNGPKASGPRYYFAIQRAESRRRRPPPSPPVLAAPVSAAAALAVPATVPASASPFATAPGPGSLSPVGSGAVTPGLALAGAASSGPAPSQCQYNGRASMESDTMSTLPALKRAMPSAFTDVRLGPLIGRGAYGRVYRASWNGTTVAVKVIETTESLGEGEGVAPGKSGIFEAVLSSNLSHPNIVHTYQYAFRPVSPDERDERISSGSGSSGIGRPPSINQKTATEVWLVSEFCNRGPLLTAIERGAFLTQPSSQYGQPNLISVLQTLQEIAAALQYLHRNDILHGDLTGGNVLLTASDKDTRGFTAKVVDFGLSRVCSGEYLRTRTLGCAEYMPPELITEGILTKAADVYAFGVITWEIYCGRRAWDGLKPTEVLRKVASNTKLEFPTQTPHRLKILGERCMEYQPSSRPTMDEVLSEVNSILSDTMGILQQFLAASTAAAATGAGAGGPALLQPSDPFR
ncbi:hypothetical protein ABPG77_003085 [Micractinium sp. CCAP 211/92]